jgi:hypothetical protein
LAALSKNGCARIRDDIGLPANRLARNAIVVGIQTADTASFKIMDRLRARPHFAAVALATANRSVVFCRCSCSRIGPVCGRLIDRWVGHAKEFIVVCYNSAWENKRLPSKV